MSFYRHLSRDRCIPLTQIDEETLFFHVPNMFQKFSLKFGSNQSLNGLRTVKKGAKKAKIRQNRQIPRKGWTGPLGINGWTGLGI